ncbi:MAG: helix-turn-helix domain-containing protein [Candidatus Coproplasma sp.]
MKLNEKIKLERTRHNFSQLKLGEFLHVTQQAVAKWEKGIAEPDSENLIAMAQLFNVSTDYLLGCNNITDEEYAAGARATVRKNLTPIEDDMLYAFREVGKKLGEKGQQALIDVAEGMAGIK